MRCSIRRREAIGEGTLTGKWRCRTIKLGGLTPDVVYSWFNCRISHRDGGLFFEKVTGSQRVAGVLYPREEGGYVLLGAQASATNRRIAIPAITNRPARKRRPTTRSACCRRRACNHARIEFPYPVQESTFDVIELKR